MVFADMISKEMHVGYTGTEHILAGIIREGTGVGAAILKESRIYESRIMDLMREMGIEVVEFTDEEVMANAEKCREMTWPKIEKEYGKEVMDGLKADIEALQK